MKPHPPQLSWFDHESTQVPEQQSGRLPAQMRPQLPQLFGSFETFVQVPPQLRVPDGQVQTPPTQLVPAAHRRQEDPQLFTSVERSTHVPWQQFG